MGRRDMSTPLGSGRGMRRKKALSPTRALHAFPPGCCREDSEEARCAGPPGAGRSERGRRGGRVPGGELGFVGGPRPHGGLCPRLGLSTRRSWGLCEPLSHLVFPESLDSPRYRALRPGARPGGGKPRPNCWGDKEPRVRSLPPVSPKRAFCS